MSQSENDTLRQLAKAKGLAFKEIIAHFRELDGQMGEVQQTVIDTVVRAATVEEVRRVIDRMKQITFLG